MAGTFQGKNGMNIKEPGRWGIIIKYLKKAKDHLPTYFKTNSKIDSN